MTTPRTQATPNNSAATNDAGEWLPIETAPEGVIITTKIDDDDGPRNECDLIKITRVLGKTRPMFFVPDQSMYVYYTPTHWKHTDAPAQS